MVLREIRDDFKDILPLLLSFKNNLIKEALGWKNAPNYLKWLCIHHVVNVNNNASERHVKPYVIGRKDWLFSFTKNGAEITCGLYTLIRTAVENGINANKYLEYLLNTLGKNPSSDVCIFLPRSEEIKETFGLK